MYFFLFYLREINYHRDYSLRLLFWEFRRSIEISVEMIDQFFFFFFTSQLARFFSKKSRSREISRSNFSSSTKPFNPIKKKNGRDGFYRSRNLVSKRPFDKRAIYQRSERSWSYLMSSWNFFFTFYFFFLSFFLFYEDQRPSNTVRKICFDPIRELIIAPPNAIVP